MINRNHQQGVAMLSTLVALPLLGVLIGGAIQMGLLYQAKSILNHAAMTAARAGATHNASTDAINNGLARGLLPLYVGSANYGDMKSRLQQRVRSDVSSFSCVKIINPNREAFIDFDVTPADPVFDKTISVYELHTLPNTVGGASGTSIQDAMILKINVVYGARAEVPIIGPLIASLLRNFTGVSGTKKRLLENNRIPIEVAAVVRMQSNARMNGMMASRGQEGSC